jgi:hypothetical protein
MPWEAQFPHDFAAAGAPRAMLRRGCEGCPLTFP